MEPQDVGLAIFEYEFKVVHRYGQGPERHPFGDISFKFHPKHWPLCLKDSDDLYLVKSNVESSLRRLILEEDNIAAKLLLIMMWSHLLRDMHTEFWSVTGDLAHAALFGLDGSPDKYYADCTMLDIRRNHGIIQGMIS